MKTGESTEIKSLNREVTHASTAHSRNQTSTPTLFSLLPSSSVSLLHFDCLLEYLHVFSSPFFKFNLFLFLPLHFSNILHLSTTFRAVSPHYYFIERHYHLVLCLILSPYCNGIDIHTLKHTFIVMWLFVALMNAPQQGLFMPQQSPLSGSCVCRWSWREDSRVFTHSTMSTVLCRSCRRTMWVYVHTDTHLPIFPLWSSL